MAHTLQQAEITSDNLIKRLQKNKDHKHSWDVQVNDSH